VPFRGDGATHLDPIADYRLTGCVYETEDNTMNSYTARAKKKDRFGPYYSRINGSDRCVANAGMA